MTPGLQPSTSKANANLGRCPRLGITPGFQPSARSQKGDHRPRRIFPYGIRLQAGRLSDQEIYEHLLAKAPAWEMESPALTLRIVRFMWMYVDAYTE